MTCKRLEQGGFLVMPAAMTGPAPGVVVVHENRGLNPSIDNVARRVAKAGFVILVPADLTSVVGYPSNDEKGGQSQHPVDPAMLNDFLPPTNG